MQVRVDIGWRDVTRTSFFPDRIRRNGIQFRKRKNEVVVFKDNERSVAEVKQWFKDQPDVTQYKMCGLYDATDMGVYYKGLAFHFTKDDDALMFRLSFA